MSPRQIQTFEVSLKAFIVRDGKALLVQEADTGYWELPGGRIDVGEERMAHREILAREMAEELGPQFQIEVGTEAVSWVRQRPVDGVFQFLVARVCRHVSGEPVLSDEHAACRWVDAMEWQHMTLPPSSDYQHGLAQLFGLLRR